MEWRKYLARGGDLLVVIPLIALFLFLSALKRMHRLAKEENIDLWSVRALEVVRPWLFVCGCMILVGIGILLVRMIKRKSSNRPEMASSGSTDKEAD